MTRFRILSQLEHQPRPYPLGFHYNPNPNPTPINTPYFIHNSSHQKLRVFPSPLLNFFSLFGSKPSYLKPLYHHHDTPVVHSLPPTSTSWCRDFHTPIVFKAFSFTVSFYYLKSSKLMP